MKIVNITKNLPAMKKFPIITTVLVATVFVLWSIISPLNDIGFTENEANLFERFVHEYDFSIWCLLLTATAFLAVFTFGLPALKKESEFVRKAFE